MKKKKSIINQKTAPYFFCAPFILSFCIFLVYPMINMVQTSFQKMQGIGSYKFVGLANYQRLLTDQHIGNAIWTSLLFTIGIIVVNVTLAVLLAVILNNALTPFRNLFRSALYIPALTSIIVAGIYFRLFFGSNTDTPLNTMLQIFGSKPKEWLYDTKMTGVVTLVVTSTWRWLGGLVMTLRWISPYSASTSLWAWLFCLNSNLLMQYLPFLAASPCGESP